MLFRPALEPSIREALIRLNSSRGRRRWKLQATVQQLMAQNEPPASVIQSEALGGNYSFQFPEGQTNQPGGAVGSLAELGPQLSYVTGESAVQGCNRAA